MGTLPAENLTYFSIIFNYKEGNKNELGRLSLLALDFAFASVLRTANASSAARAHSDIIFSSFGMIFGSNKKHRHRCYPQMRKPSIGERIPGSYNGCMMNRINFESVEKLNRQRLVRFVCSLFLVSSLVVFAGGCVEAGDSVEYLARGGHEGRGRDFHHSPNHHGGGNYHHPRNGNSHPGGGPTFHSPHQGGGHNSQHGPSDRNHNIGRPSNGRG